MPNNSLLEYNPPSGDVWSLTMAYVLENKAYIILNTFLSSSELRRGQGFFSFTATSTDLHLTFCVRGTKERHISLRTPSIPHSCGRVCPWKIQEWQADRLAVYLPKTQPTPLVHIRDDSRLACLRTPTFCGHLCPDRLLPCSRPTAKGRWMVLWADKVPVSHKADGSGAWPLLQLPILPLLLVSLSTCPSVYMITFPNAWIPEWVDVPFGPSWRMCLLSLLLSRVVLSLVLFSSPWQVCPKCGVRPPLSP